MVCDLPAPLLRGESIITYHVDVCVSVTATCRTYAQVNAHGEGDAGLGVVPCSKKVTQDRQQAAGKHWRRYEPHVGRNQPNDASQSQQPYRRAVYIVIILGETLYMEIESGEWLLFHMLL